MMKGVLKYLILLTLLISMIFVYGFSNYRNQAKHISDINVEFESGENYFLTHEMVNKLLIQNDTSFKNKAKSVIDLYRLEEQVLKNPYIEKASLYITIDGTLHSLIKQRTPVARIITSNETFYLDKEGVKVPLSNQYSARVLLVTGVKTDQNLEKIKLLIKKITADDFLTKEIIGIHINDSAECLMTVRSGDYKIVFGELSQADEKFKKLKAFYNKTFLDSTIRKYKTINIKYHNQVVGVK